MYLTTGATFKPQKYVIQLQYENVDHPPPPQADPDNQGPDKWSSTVLENSSVLMLKFVCYFTVNGLSCYRKRCVVDSPLGPGTFVSLSSVTFR